jgi:hypothetical protein
MRTMRVIEIFKENSVQFSVIVSDGQEMSREGIDDEDKFLEESESFLKDRYGERVSVTHREIVAIEYNGSAFFTLQSNTEGIMENIAEEFGLEIKQPQK